MKVLNGMSGNATMRVPRKFLLIRRIHKQEKRGKHMNNYADIFKDYIAKAQDAERGGDYRQARIAYISAAEKLLECALAQGGEVQLQLKQEAQAIITHADKLDISQIKPPSTKQARDEKDELPQGKFVPIDAASIEIGIDGIAGMHKAKELLRTIMEEVMEYQDLADKLPLMRQANGVLIVGPPGTGKTTFARAVAKEIDAPFFHIMPSSIKDKYVGGSEKNLRDTFDAARNYERAILFFDDVDGVFPDRGGIYSTNADNSLLTEFLNQTEGVKSHGCQLFLMGTANQPWLLDGAAKRRFKHTFHAPLPDLEARRFLFMKKLEGHPLASHVNTQSGGDRFAELARLTAGLNGDDITRLCASSCRMAFKRGVAVRKRGGSREEEDAAIKVRMEDIINELKGGFIPSVRKEDVARLEKYMADLGRADIVAG
jgi:SpoVK/Ycf46/Vps4 family AAA+-type ATPase